jgi:hypothetical protein
LYIKVAAFIASFIVFARPVGSLADTGPANQPNPQPSASAAVSTEEAAAATAPTGAAPTEAQLAALAKEAQNPVGNVAVFPFQNNFNYSAGPNKLPLYNLNIQPVIPVMLSPKMNLIERAIVPFINQPSSLSPQLCPPQFGSQLGCGSQLGIGSIQLQSYFAPKVKPGELIYGVGPLFQFPTVTKNFGSNQVGAGINAVGLVMPGPWVMGLLVAQQWRVAGPSAPSAQTLNSFLTQPFVNFNFGRGWALSESPSITANWNAPGNQKWTVPLGLAVVQTNTWFKLPMSFQLAYYGNVVRPNFAPYGQIRFQWALIWPITRGRTR